MRGEARGRAASSRRVQQELRQAKPVAEDARLLPAGARGARHGGVVAERPRDGRRAALQSRHSQDGSVPSRLYRRAFRPFHRRRARPHAGRSRRPTIRATFDPAKAYADCTAPADGRARPEGSVDMGTGYDCTDLKAHTAATSITPAQRRWRSAAGRGNGAARLCELFQGVVAFFAAGGGRGAYDFPIQPRRH